ncbi:MAG: NAD(P)H-binding protein [Dysgonomonas sp.]
MKKVVLIGATGFVGSHLLKELLSRGYNVTAIARSTSKIEIKNGNPKVVNVDINDVKALTEVIKGNDIVLSAFNAGWTNPNLYDDFIKGSESIEQAVKNSGVKRYIVIGGAGSLYVDGKQLVDGPDFPSEIKPGATAARDYLTHLRSEKELDWTYFSPAPEMHQGITTGRTGKYRLGTENPVVDASGRSFLSVEDLSVAVVDELENHKYSRQRFTAGY